MPFKLTNRKTGEEGGWIPRIKTKTTNPKQRKPEVTYEDTELINELLVLKEDVEKLDKENRKKLKV